MILAFNKIILVLLKTGVKGHGWNLTDLFGTYCTYNLVKNPVKRWWWLESGCLIDVVKEVELWVYFKMEPAGFNDRLHVCEAEEPRITASIWPEQLKVWSCG